MPEAPPSVADLPAFVIAFVGEFAAALTVNVGIAAAAIALGLLAGTPLAVLAQFGGGLARVAGWLVAPLRAAPTFVVMFFLLNALPASLQIGPWQASMSPWLAVVLALAVYATAYVADNGREALGQWRAGRRGAALLFPTGLLRAFFVMVLSSGFGAAVGVEEATHLTLRTLESLPGTGQRLALMAGVVAMFTLLFQGLYAAVDALRAALAQRLGVA